MLFKTIRAFYEGTDYQKRGRFLGRNFTARSTLRAKVRLSKSVAAGQSTRSMTHSLRGLGELQKEQHPRETSVEAFAMFRSTARDFLEFRGGMSSAGRRAGDSL